jgi:hypothetical protein
VSDTVERPEIAVAYVACDGAGPAIRACWERLEAVVLDVAFLRGDA